MVISHNFYMSLALAEAWKYQILTFPNPAVGATVVSPCGKILAVEAHQKAGEPHAEVNALKKAYKVLTGDEGIEKLSSSHEIHTYLKEHHNDCFVGCEIYTTLEPCAHVGKTPSCASLICELGLQKVYIGSRDPNVSAAGGAERLSKAGIDVEFAVLQKECNALLLPFLRLLQGGFVFFKWAQRLDGSTTGGIISSEASRRHVHALRNVCDLLVIGGNTVRIDRPTLDARLVGGRAPDVLIYSRQKEFDSSIPLFGVPGREVIISDSLEIIKNYKCVMIEGGANMMAAAAEYIDMYLVYIAPHFAKERRGAELEMNFQILNQQKVGDDILMWLTTKT